MAKTQRRFPSKLMRDAVAGIRRIDREHGRRRVAITFAVVGVGAGVAMAKAKLDRRTARRGRSLGRDLSLEHNESLWEELHRMTLDQLDLAIELLKDNGQPSERSIHETRKALKRLRTLIRLMRKELGPKRFARENAILRDTGRRLAPARDAQVMVEAIEKLIDRHPQKLTGRPGVSKLYTELTAQRDLGWLTWTSKDIDPREDLLKNLQATRLNMAKWRSSSQDFQMIRPGLDRIYRQGRKRMNVAQKKKDSRSLHQWRKRVKDLRYACEMLDRPDVKRNKDLKRLRKLADRAERLGELLGEEHDLALLAERIKQHKEFFDGDLATRKTLLKLIAGRRKRLRRRAIGLGVRIYEHNPRRFLRLVARAIAHA
jgi:CHAD domain-containing protein